MSTIINADTSDGLKFTSDTSGEIKLQSAGTDIVSVTANGMAVDTNTLYVDATNNRVGIGTSSLVGRLRTTLATDGLISLFNGTTYGLTINSSSSESGAKVEATDPTGTASFQPLILSGSINQFKTGGTERMRIDSSGRVTMPYQPSFKAYSTGGQINSNNVSLVFSNVTSFGGHNIGNHYNTSNGVFTAPISGRYLFSAAMLTNPANMGNGNANIQWVINGSFVHYLAHNHLSSWVMESGAVIFNLSANDTVNLYLITGSGHYGTYSHFSGCLIG